MSFKQSADIDGFIPDMEAKTPLSEETYELHLETSPGSAKYEATLTYSIRKDTFTTRVGWGHLIETIYSRTQRKIKCLHKCSII